MQRATDRPVGLGNQLALEYSLTDLDHRHGPVTDVLQQRQYKPGWQRHLFQSAGGGLGLVLRRMDAAGDIPDARLGSHQAAPRWASVAITWYAGRGKSQPQFCGVTTTGSMSMQSTGQGSTHRSHPVHSSAMTVCMCLAAPRMASTGQAWMHLVQPMHSASRMNATVRGFSSPCSPSSGRASTSSRSARA